MNNEPRLTRKQMLAAELFGYSYANYEDHIGINVRFDRLMPDDVDTLEQAEREEWNAQRIAQALEIPTDRVAKYQRMFQEGREIIDTPSLAQSFRCAVRTSIQHATEAGLGDMGSIERLTTQICYRAADLAFRLDMNGERLSDYSEKLRIETEYDMEYQSRLIRKEIARGLAQKREEGDADGATDLL